MASAKYAYDRSPTAMKLKTILVFMSSSSLIINGQMQQQVSFKPCPMTTINGFSLCATDEPLKAFDVRSKLDCIYRCTSTNNPLCSSVNYWDDGKRCELYSESPQIYEIKPGCVHLKLQVDVNVKECSPISSSTPVLCLTSAGSLMIPVQLLSNWIIVQETVGVSFNWLLPWADYKKGFGQIGSNYWIGLEKLYQLTTAAAFKVRIEVHQVPQQTGSTLWLEMTSFIVGSEVTNYKRTWSGMTGSPVLTTNAWPGPPDVYENNLMFTTIDRDNDPFAPGNCASFQGGGWWFSDCYATCSTCVKNAFMFSGFNCAGNGGFNAACATVCADHVVMMIVAV